MASLSNIVKFNFYTVLFWSFSFLFLFPSIMTVLPLVETRMYPVLGEQEVTILEKFDDRIVFEVEFQKKRDCRLSSVDWVAIRNGRRYSMMVQNPAGQESVGRANFEKGTYVTGPYTAYLPPLSRPPEEIKAIVYYDCHFLYKIKQEFAPLKVY